MLLSSVILLLGPAGGEARRGEAEAVLPLAPAPVPAVRTPAPAARPGSPPAGVPSHSMAEADLARQAAISAARSWGYQLSGLAPAEAGRSPYDLLVLDATTGHAADRPFRHDEIEALKSKPDGSRRLVVSYLSIGEAEDYRSDYFTAEYLSEDAPDWLLGENPAWKGNRLIRFCSEGWQQTILGDGEGRNVYNSVEPAPLTRLVELGLDGVYLDRVDVYQEVAKACPDAERRMIAFVRRLAEQARRLRPDFLVILQNAEELLARPEMIAAIDAVAKEDLFYGIDHSEKANPRSAVEESLAHLRRARAAGRPVFVVDYLQDRGKITDARRRIEAEGFIPYFAPRNLDALWIRGRNF
ncbi:MAG: endo alpha-1,4 polygalactosaminidase [Pseudomonadota bacterium]